MVEKKAFLTSVRAVKGGNVLVDSCGLGAQYLGQPGRLRSAAAGACAVGSDAPCGPPPSSARATPARRAKRITTGTVKGRRAFSIT